MKLLNWIILSSFLLGAQGTTEAAPLPKIKPSDKPWVKLPTGGYIGSNSMRQLYIKMSTASSWKQLSQALKSDKKTEFEDGADVLAFKKQTHSAKLVDWLLGKPVGASIFGFCQGTLYDGKVDLFGCTSLGKPPKSVEFVLYDFRSSKIIGNGELGDFKSQPSDEGQPKGFDSYSAKTTELKLAGKPETGEVIAMFDLAHSDVMDIKSTTPLPHDIEKTLVLSDNYYQTKFGMRDDLNQAVVVDYFCKCESAISSYEKKPQSTPFNCKQVDQDYTCSKLYYKVFDRWLEIWRSTPA